MDRAVGRALSKTAQVGGEEVVGGLKGVRQNAVKAPRGAQAEQCPS